jgi:hypothetical protein
VTAEPHGSREQVAGWTTTLTDDTLATIWTFVHGVDHESPLPLQTPTEIGLLRSSWRSVAQAIAELFVGR